LGAARPALPISFHCDSGSHLNIQLDWVIILFNRDLIDQLGCLYPRLPHLDTQVPISLSNKAFDLKGDHLSLSLLPPLPPHQPCPRFPRGKLLPLTALAAASQIISNQRQIRRLD